MAWKSTGSLNPYDNMFRKYFERAGKCPKCGSDMLRHRPIDKFSGKKIPAVCPVCGYMESKREYERLLKQKTEWTLQGRKSSALGFFSKYSILADLDSTNASFANFITQTRAEKGTYQRALEIAQKMTDEIVHTVMIGATGRGKTHLAMAIIKKVWDYTDYGKKAIFLNIPELINEFRQGFERQDIKNKIDGIMYQMTYRNKGSDGRFHGSFDILVLDDLGAERQTDYTISIIDTIAQSIPSKSVILTSNLNGNEMKAKYGDRFMSRLKEHGIGNSISFKGIEDHRGIDY